MSYDLFLKLWSLLTFALRLHTHFKVQQPKNGVGGVFSRFASFLETPFFEIKNLARPNE